jgi:hypothetical protein
MIFKFLTPCMAHQINGNLLTGSVRQYLDMKIQDPYL